MKALIISHNPITTQNNMGKTFLTLFSCFEREELCQLYIYPTLPNVDRCASFYRVTDKEVLRSLLRWKRPGGEIDPSRICQSEGLYENAEDESFYRSKKNKSPVRRMLRDAMWRMSGWYSPALRTWLDEQQPDCIFVAPGVAKFLYDIALKIAKKRDIPVITYICDEYYFVKPPEALLDRLRLKSLQRRVESLMARSAHLVVICDELKQAYAGKFGIETTTLMTGASRPAAQKPQRIEAPKDICYFGNIRCNRYLSLGDVGRELDAINAELGTGHRLKIYTSEKDAEILASFDGIDAIELCGFVTGAAFEKAMGEAELLLHVEAFDEDSIDYVQHSVSTKIADSLASGKPLLAYGPACVSSMKHLSRNGCAMMAESKETLRPMLLRAFSDGAARNAAVEKALQVAKDCHDSNAASMKLKQIMADVIESGREEKRA